MNEYLHKSILLKRNSFLYSIKYISALLFLFFGKIKRYHSSSVILEGKSLFIVNINILLNRNNTATIYFTVSHLLNISILLKATVIYHFICHSSAAICLSRKSIVKFNSLLNFSSIHIKKSLKD